MTSFRPMLLLASTLMKADSCRDLHTTTVRPQPGNMLFSTDTADAVRDPFSFAWLSIRGIDCLIRSKKQLSTRRRCP